MGYFLGLMIATTVDYRLKNFVVNLPRPKNNIVVKLNKNTKIKTQKVMKIKKKISKKIVEGFAQNKRKKGFNIEKKDQKKIKNRAKEDPKKDTKKKVKKKPILDSTTNDQNSAVYAQMYKQNSKKKEQDLIDFNYNAYNMEDSDQNFTFLEKTKRSNKPVNALQKSNTILKDIHKKVACIKKLIPKKKTNNGSKNPFNTILKKCNKCSL